MKFPVITNDNPKTKLWAAMIHQTAQSYKPEKPWEGPIGMTLIFNLPMPADDDRFLWPEVIRAVEGLRPTWLLLENVAGFATLAQFDVSPPVDANAPGGTQEFHGLPDRVLGGEGEHLSLASQIGQLCIRALRQ